MKFKEVNINKLFYNWLLISFILVFCMVIVGGLTRLTDSGLSITKWELFTGILPPLTDVKWNEYFDLYKKIPQYQILNKDMLLSEFKIIFYWEYFHRILGRIIGLFFLIPLIIFYIYGKIDKRLMSQCLVIFLLILLQGIIGWYMVVSGLTDKVTVSHYRLSIHLSIAIIIISLIFWILINLKDKSLKKFFINKKQNYPFYILIVLIFSQIIVGAFVSGLDAGRVYQSWPLMNYTYFPDDVVIKNFFDFFDFDNHSLIQFYHRNLAYIITLYVLYLGYLIIKKRDQAILKAYSILLFFLILQIFLGVYTLISGLNIYLASSHQISSLLLVLSVINLCHKYVK